MQHSNLRSYYMLMTISSMFLCSVFFCRANAQQKIVIKEKKQKLPSWITMMDDSTANYNDAVKSFNDYWKNKEKPTEENELFEGSENPTTIIQKSTFSKKEEKDKEEESSSIKYSFEYKKFLVWQQAVAPYVQPDGHILTPNERIKVWQEQQQQLKDQLKKTAKNNKPVND